jgi:hypothetical protein
MEEEHAPEGAENTDNGAEGEEALYAEIPVSDEIDPTAKYTVELTHFNKSRADIGGLYLYSAAFSTVSTRASSDGWAVRFRMEDGARMTLSSSIELVVDSLYEGRAGPDWRRLSRPDGGRCFGDV